MDRSTRNSKRKTPSTEPTEPSGAKRAKPSGRNLRSGAEKKSDENSEYTPEQRYWIRLHFYMVDYAVLNRPYTAPSGAVSCAYFNAYWQGFTIEPSKEQGTDTWKDPATQFPIRTFADFDGMRRNLVPDILNNIATNSLENIANGPFRPVITPANLAEFRGIYDRYGDENGFNFANEPGRAEMNDFLERTINEHLLPEDETLEPSWMRQGRDNITSRSNPRHYKAARWEWHQDPSHPRDPKDFLRAFNPATGNRDYIRMVNRRSHADAGNALLNMAVMRPEGYDGDLNSLIFDVSDLGSSAMTEEQREEFRYHLGAAACGYQLRQIIDDQAWSDEAAKAAEVAKTTKATKTARSTKTSRSTKTAKSTKTAAPAAPAAPAATVATVASATTAEAATTVEAAEAAEATEGVESEVGVGFKK